MDQSKSNEEKEKVLCFLCKQHIPKSQAKAHNATCKKGAGEGAAKKGASKYSPIREHPEELQSSATYSEYESSQEPTMVMNPKAGKGSSTVSNHTLFSKQVAEFSDKREDDSEEEEDESYQSSGAKKPSYFPGGHVNSVKVARYNHHHNKPSPIKKRQPAESEGGSNEEEDEEDSKQAEEMEAVMRRKRL